MIKLLVDGAYALDYHAILKVKHENNPNKISEQALVDCSLNLSVELGIDDFLDILGSDEYIHLVEANQKTFDAVEKARYGKISAKEVDDCNMERYNAKKALQAKFFSKQEQVEQKS